MWFLRIPQEQDYRSTFSGMVRGIMLQYMSAILCIMNYVTPLFAPTQVLGLKVHVFGFIRRLQFLYECVKEIRTFGFSGFQCWPLQDIKNVINMSCVHSTPAVQSGYSPHRKGDRATRDRAWNSCCT